MRTRRSPHSRCAALAAVAALLLAVAPAPAAADEELPPPDFGEFRVTVPSDEPRPAPATKTAETPRRRRSPKAAAGDSRPVRTPERSPVRATTVVAAKVPTPPATPEVKPVMPEVKPATAAPLPSPQVALASSPVPAPAPRPAEPAAAPRAPSTDSMAGVGAKLLLASLALAALLWGASRVVRRLPLGNLLPSADGPIRVVARTHLGPKTSLCLLEVAGTTVLVAMTPTGMQTLHVWAEGEAPSPAAALAAATPRPASATPGQLRGLETRITGKRG